MLGLESECWELTVPCLFTAISHGSLILPDKVRRWGGACCPVGLWALLFFAPEADQTPPTERHLLPFLRVLSYLQSDYC